MAKWSKLEEVLVRLADAADPESLLTANLRYVQTVVQLVPDKFAAPMRSSQTVDSSGIERILEVLAGDAMIAKLAESSNPTLGALVRILVRDCKQLDETFDAEGGHSGKASPDAQSLESGLGFYPPELPTRDACGGLHGLQSQAIAATLVLGLSEKQTGDNRTPRATQGCQTRV